MTAVFGGALFKRAVFFAAAPTNNNDIDRKEQKGYN